MGLLDRVLDGSRTKAGQIAVVICGAVVFLGVLFPPLDGTGQGLAGITKRELSTPIWSGDLHDKHYPLLPAASDSQFDQMMRRPDYSQRPESVDYFEEVDWGRLVVEWLILAVLFAAGMSVAGIVVSPVDGDRGGSGDRDQGSS
jgi:hypothetical protein